MALDVVREFNNELSSLYEVKPPISKAKMMQITKSAIKGIKFYKHVVQSVEKFIQKCRPEYKIPGLYVIDSIVRQSRHQFGQEKDVFAPRFMKNIITTFQNLFHCSAEDRARIVRVLNLWQKNAVFPSDIIQPLLDMANPNSEGEWPAYDNAPQQQDDSPVRKAASQPPATETTQNSRHKSAELSAWKGWPQGVEEPPPPDAHNYTEMSTKNVEKFTKANSSGVPDTVVPTTVKNEVKTQEENTVIFNKKLLDFDYDDEEDEEEAKGGGDDGQTSLVYNISQNLLSNPGLLRQLQQMQQTIQQNESLSELAMQSQPVIQNEHKDNYSPALPDCKIPPSHPFLGSQLTVQPPPTNVMYSYDTNAIGFPPLPPQMPPLQHKPPMEISYQHPMLSQETMLMQSSQVDEDERMIYSMPGEPPLPPQDLDERSLIIPGDVKEERSRSRSGSVGRGRTGRHRTRSRSPRRRKSRSTSRSRSRRNRSRSKDRERQKEREREREKERERRKKGLPTVRKNSVSVCSTTLWLGHVPKTVAEEEIASTFGEFGSVSTIDMIPPRGCAYVVMDRRQDAYRALTKLKNLKLQCSSIKMAWAPGKGTKGKEFKDYWEVESGVSYIPFEKLSNGLHSLDLLEEGGYIDEDSLPQQLRDLRQQRESAKASANEKPQGREKSMDKNGIVTQAAPMPPTMLPPNMSAMPVVMHHQMMQPQYGMPLPGMMPPQPMVVQHMQMPVGVPPPNTLMMVQPPSQNTFPGAPLPVGAVPQMPPHLSMSHPSVPSVTLSLSHMSSGTPNTESSKEISTSTLTANDATPTDEDGTRVASPPLSMTTAVSSAALPAVTMAQFNSAVGFPPRQLVPGLPPGSAPNSLSFPPPHMQFGFPPPGLRPPTQNMPVVSLNSAFPWQQKPAPHFAGYATDARYPTGATPGNLRPLLSQPGQITNVTMGNQSPMASRPVAPGNTAQTNKEPTNQSTINDKEAIHHLEQRSNDGFGGRSSMPPKNFNRSASPASYDNSHEMDIDQEDVPHEIFQSGKEDFPRDHMGVMPPRYPGHQDFHHGGMRGRWIPRPAGMPMQRFPHGMHGAPQFQPRGPRGPFQRMEMDYFPPQGPPPTGPRMLGINSHGPPPRRGGGNFPPPPRGQDRFSNRSDFYNESHFEDEERNRGHNSREGWDPRHGQWEEPSRRTEENRTPLSYEKDKTEQKEANPPEAPTKATFGESETKSAKPEVKSEVKPVTLASEPVTLVSKGPKNKTKAKRPSKDLFSDMFRLQNYGHKPKGKGAGPAGKIKKEAKKVDTTAKETIQPTVKNTEPLPSIEEKPTIPIQPPTMETPVVSSTTNDAVSLPAIAAEPAVIKEVHDTASVTAIAVEPAVIKEVHVEKKLLDTTKVGLSLYDSQDNISSTIEHNAVNETVQEFPNRRERDRKRSRWGRTLSEEREFQQQKINEANTNGSSEVINDVPVVANAMSIDMFSDSVNQDKTGLEVASDSIPSSKTITDNCTEDIISLTSTEADPLVNQDPTCVTNSVSVGIVETETSTPIDSTSDIA